MNTFNTQRRWYKDTVNKKVSGVCSGLAHWLDYPVWATRLAALLLLISFPVTTVLCYFIAQCCLEDK